MTSKAIGERRRLKGAAARLRRGVRRVADGALLWRRSPLARRVLAVNLIAVLIPVAGLSYMGEYRRGLYAARLADLSADARTVASALGAAAAFDDEALRADFATLAMRRLAGPNQRVRLFGVDGGVIADTRRLSGPYGGVIVRALPPPDSDRSWLEVAAESVERLFVRIFPSEQRELYVEAATTQAADHPEALTALDGERASAARLKATGDSVLIASAPVRRYRQVLAAVMISADAHDVERAVADARENILLAAVVALALTLALSLYLAAAIVSPIRRLAQAAERVRHGHGRVPAPEQGPGESYWASRRDREEGGHAAAIPDMTRREDEIGELSGALREMTESLWRRMDGLERFAADVAHEIKNPLSSLGSAIETLRALPADDARRETLLQIVGDDVRRLDRLISEVSDFSRLDAEMSRVEPAPVDLGALLDALAGLHREGWAATGPQLALALPERTVEIEGDADRIAQVVRNLMANAGSFCRKDGAVRLSLERDDKWARVTVEDDGPGLPPGKEDAVFERFYSARPSHEGFGRHSGLGLSICRRIVDAHGGRIFAETRRDDDGAPLGARFTVALPARPPRKEKAA